MFQFRIAWFLLPKQSPVFSNESFWITTQPFGKPLSEPTVSIISVFLEPTISIISVFLEPNISIILVFLEPTVSKISVLISTGPECSNFGLISYIDLMPFSYLESASQPFRSTFIPPTPLGLEVLNPATSLYLFRFISQQDPECLPLFKFWILPTWFRANYKCCVDLLSMELLANLCPTYYFSSSM